MRRLGLLALSVGPKLNLAKLLGKMGFPGPRSATGFHASLVAPPRLKGEFQPPPLLTGEFHPPLRPPSPVRPLFPPVLIVFESGETHAPRPARAGIGGPRNWWIEGEGEAGAGDVVPLWVVPGIGTPPLGVVSPPRPVGDTVPLPAPPGATE